MTGHSVTRNNKHVKITAITAKQYLRDELTQHTDDLILNIETS